MEVKEKKASDDKYQEFMKAQNAEFVSKNAMDTTAKNHKTLKADFETWKQANLSSARKQELSEQWTKAIFDNTKCKDNHLCGKWKTGTHQDGGGDIFNSGCV